MRVQHFNPSHTPSIRDLMPAEMDKTQDPRSRAPALAVGYYEGLLRSFQPLFWVILLLYICPGLFRDRNAESLAASCGLDGYNYDVYLG